MKSSALLLAALVLAACGPVVLPDTNPQIQTLRHLHQQFTAATGTRMLEIQTDARQVSEGLDERRLPSDLRPWVHHLRTDGLAFQH